MVSASAQILEKRVPFLNSSLSTTAHLSQFVKNHAGFSALGFLEEELNSEREGLGLFSGHNSQAALIHVLGHLPTMSRVFLRSEIVAKVVQNSLCTAQQWGLSQGAWQVCWVSSANTVYFSTESVIALILLLVQ